MKYTGHFSQICSISITVEAPEGTDCEELIELAYQDAPSQLGAQDSGWGRSWYRELNEEMETEAGTDLWTSKECWTRITDKEED